MRTSFPLVAGTAALLVAAATPPIARAQRLESRAWFAGVTSPGEGGVVYLVRLSVWRPAAR